MYTYIDLFSGPGGLCTGFKSAGFKPLIAVEWSDWTVKTYAENHNATIYELATLIENKGSLEKVIKKDNNTVLIHGDIKKVDDELIVEILKKQFNTDYVDVVTGGAPCESFSMAGTRKENDERDELFESILRIGKAVKSRFVLFENVEGLLTKKKSDKKGGYFEYILNKFEEDFILSEKEPKKIVLKASDYGVPQNRKRLFLIGYNTFYGKKNNFKYPEPEYGENRKYSYVTVKEALEGLPKIGSGEGEEVMNYNYNYKEEFQNGKISEGALRFLDFIHGEKTYIPEHIKYNTEIVYYHKAINHSLKMIERFKNIKQGEGMKHAAERLIAEGNSHLIEKVFPKKLYAARNRRLKENEPSFTVTSHCLDEMIHYEFDRQLTPREVARLQSFPDWYKIVGPYVKFHSDPEQDKYEQIGDAIPVLLAFKLAQQLKIALDELEK